MKKEKSGAKAEETAPAEAPWWREQEWAICAGLIALTAVVFARVTSHEFLNFDDVTFVTSNRPVLDFDLGWAFTSTQLSWMPLTWISYMIDVRLFGLHAGAFLIENVVLHALSACILFAALRLMTRAVWPSAFVAALFAVHPAHVESVAWIAERKDVLSTLFAFLAIFFYARRKMTWTAVAMVLSLMAKQTYVTLPFLLILLDYWPLDRLRSAADLRPLVKEKLPLFGVAILGSIAAYAGQASMGAVTSSAAIPLIRRLANAVVSYVRYLGKLFLPVRLSPLYPLEHLANTKVLACLGLLIIVTAAAIVLRKRAPYFLTGWLWFLGALIPVIGIVQIGGQAIADRYTYFAYTGIFIALVWGAMELRVEPRALANAGIIVVALLAAMAFRQTAYWKNPDTLFTHTLEVTGPNAVAEYLLGQYLQLSDPARALVHLNRAIDMGKGFAANRDNKMFGWYPQAHASAAAALLVQARALPPGPQQIAKLRESIAMNQRCLQIDPDVFAARQNITIAEQLIAQQQPQMVHIDFRTFLDRAVKLGREGKFNEAVVEYRKAVAVVPKAIEVHVYLGLGLLQAGQKAEAAAELRQAKSMNAARANEIVTLALHLQPSPENIDLVIAAAQK